jgi:hypothetical protein
MRPERCYGHGYGNSMMNEGEWIDGKRLVTCACGWQRTTHWHLAQIHHSCKLPPRTTPCSHLGPELRREECPTCAGKVQVKVFACAVFGETSLAKPLPGVQVCLGCPRYGSVLI